MCVVEQLHKQRDELSILSSVSDDVLRITEVAVHHGLDGRAQFPQQLPRSGGQFTACQRISMKGNFHPITTNCKIRVNTKLVDEKVLGCCGSECRFPCSRTVLGILENE